MIRGEVYWITARGARGREQTGRRPALIIQNDSGNATSDSTIIALMTSRRFSREYPFHVSVGPDETGLDEGSTVLLEQIQTVDIGRLGQRIGMLSFLTMQQVGRALHHSLGLVGCPQSI